ncbi:MAG: Asp-tRNA(Asn)/Glu-tRNA(Gln) amidotransferase subunit GatB [Bacteroidota bacterium]
MTAVESHSPSPSPPVWQAVIGLEIHVQLNTRSKVFATEASGFQKNPNQHVSSISLAHPGALPSINQECLQLAVLMGLATNCKIHQHCHFARKNYFYPDLPKGYQLSQDQTPICYEGKLSFPLQDGSSSTIRIHQIHIEEDAGKSIHDQHPSQTFIDLNRAGVGLIEIVTEPDLRTAIQAGAAVAEIRRIVRYLGVSDGNMETGNLRCDANVSIMPVGNKEFGTRVEIKNINSISHVIKAIEHEIDRQIQWVEAGNSVIQETRTWNVDLQRTQPMRDKETADDYRYFPEPDLLPVFISDEDILASKARIPPLPAERFIRYHHTYGLPLNESMALIEDRTFSDYFESLLDLNQTPKASANWLLGSVRAHLNEHQLSIDEFVLQPAQLNTIIELIQSGQITHHAAKEQLLPAMIKQPQTAALELARELDLLIESKQNELEAAMDRLIEKFPNETARYRSGKKKLLGFFVGQLMREFKGKADPKEVNQVVRTKLHS